MHAYPEAPSDATAAPDASATPDAHTDTNSNANTDLRPAAARDGQLVAGRWERQ
jgi:hypothetical protein